MGKRIPFKKCLQTNPSTRESHEFNGEALRRLPLPQFHLSIIATWGSVFAFFAWVVHGWFRSTYPQPPHLYFLWRLHFFVDKGSSILAHSNEHKRSCLNALVVFFSIQRLMVVHSETVHLSDSVCLSILTWQICLGPVPSRKTSFIAFDNKDVCFSIQSFLKVIWGFLVVMFKSLPSISYGWCFLVVSFVFQFDNFSNVSCINVYRKTTKYIIYPSNSRTHTIHVWYMAYLPTWMVDIYGKCR